MLIVILSEAKDLLFRKSKPEKSRSFASLRMTILMSSPNYTIRPASAADVEHLLHHRRAMFCEMGHTEAAALDAMEACCRPVLAKALRDGSYRSWVAETGEGGDAMVVAGSGVMILPWLPSAVDPLAAPGIDSECLYRIRLSPPGNCPCPDANDRCLVPCGRLSGGGAARQRPGPSTL